MQELFFTYNLTEISAVAKKLLQFSLQKKVFLFDGEMGSGKTTLIKNICQQLQAETSLSSPTYSIVNEYPIHNSTVKIYHMDLYRLRDIEEALAIGIEEYIFSGNYCFIEWSDLIKPLLREEAVTVQIEVISENERKIRLYEK